MALCECGCGQKTRIAIKTDRKAKQIKGKSIRFILGHNRYLQQISPRWKGGMIIDQRRIKIWNPAHSRADSKGYVYRHLLVAERSYGKPIPKYFEVHHLDNNKLNDSPDNLVVCPNRSYHMLLHQRAKALKICGHVDWLKCPFCQIYDEPTNLHSKSHYHRHCINNYNKSLKEAISHAI